MDRYSFQIMKTVGKAINKYNMISADDRVLVALSGGKDSLALLETIALRRNHIPITYEIKAMHVAVKNYKYEIDVEYINDFCKRLNIDFIYKSIKLTDDEFNKYDKSECFSCARNRRNELFNFAIEQGFNKIAFGHHRDDILETLLLNMIYNSNISSMPPKLSMFDGRVDIIRPLVFLDNDKLEKYAQINGYKKVKRKCPYENDTKRNAVRKILNEFDNLYDKSRINMFAALSNIKTEYLP